MKLCIVCNEYPPVRHGGIGRATRTLAHSLVEAGHEVRIVGISPAGEAAPDFEDDHGVMVYRIKSPMRWIGWIRARYLLYRTVSEWSRAGLIDVIEVPDYQGLAAGWPALNIPVVARMHGSSSYFALEMEARPDRLTFLLERASLRRADFLCSSSRYTAEQTKRIFSLHGPEATVLYNYTAIPKDRPKERRIPGKVVFSGTLTPKKGVISLIRAWPAVIEECPTAELHMFGKEGRTDGRESMQEYLVSCLPEQMRHSVQFHGHVDLACLRAGFQTATAAVFPSYSEAFALAPMEAMAEICPTIYSRRASGAELIEDGKDGLLVDPDDPQDIAAAIVKVLKNPSLASELGRAGRACVEERFAPSAMIARNVEFFRDCTQAFANRRNNPERRTTPVSEKPYRAAR
jgi:glycosyltransferase involved in cell wall biosynthesis